MLAACSPGKIVPSLSPCDAENLPVPDGARDTTRSKQGTFFSPRVLDACCQQMHNSAAYAALLASNNKRTAQATALVRLACAISFLDMLGYGFLSPITYSLLNKDVIGATGFGALQSVSNAAALLAGAALGRLSDTRGRKPAIVASAAVSLLGYALYVAGRVAAGRVAADAPLAASVLPCAAQVLTTVGRAGLRLGYPARPMVKP